MDQIHKRKMIKSWKTSDFLDSKNQFKYATFSHFLKNNILLISIFGMLEIWKLIFWLNIWIFIISYFIFYLFLSNYFNLYIYTHTHTLKLINYYSNNWTSEPSNYSLENSMPCSILEVKTVVKRIGILLKLLQILCDNDVIGTTSTR